MEKLYRVIKSYLYKKSETAESVLENSSKVQSDQSSKVLSDLSNNPEKTLSYLRDKLINKNDAKKFALIDIKKNPASNIVAYLAKDLIDHEQAKVFANERIQKTLVNIPEYYRADLISKEQAKKYALKSLAEYNSEVALKYALYYFKHDLISEEEAKDFSKDKITKDFTGFIDYFKAGLLDKSKAREFALAKIKERPDYASNYVSAKILEKSEVSSFAFADAQRYPYRVFDYFNDDLITEEQARSIAINNVEGAKFGRDVLNWIESGILTKEQVKPFALKNLEKGPELALEYVKAGLVTKDQALPIAIKAFKEGAFHDRAAVLKGLMSSEDFNSIISKKLQSHDLKDFSHYHSENLVILQKLRSLAKKNKGTVSVSEMPQFKKFFSGRTELSVSDIDKIIEKEQKQNSSNSYEFGHSFWGVADVQNSTNSNQLVIQIKNLPSSVQSEISSKPYLQEYIDYIQRKNRTDHPTPLGWARIHIDKKNQKWVIDEIQSDLLSHLSESKFPQDLKEYFSEIKSFSLRHTKDVRKAILSAVTEQAHKNGINKIDHMNVEFKAKNLDSKFSRDLRYPEESHSQPVKVVNSSGELVSKTKGEVGPFDKELPPHYPDTYHEGPQKAGFERDPKTNRWTKYSKKLR